MPRGVKGLTALQVKERNLRIWELRVAAWTVAQIAVEIGLGEQRVRQILTEAAQGRGEPERAQLRQIASDKLDDWERMTLQVLRKKHVLVRGDGVVGEWRPDPVTGFPQRDETGEVIMFPLEDTAPVLSAVDRLLKIEERRSKMFGSDAAVKVESHNYDYSVNGIASEDLK